MYRVDTIPWYLKPFLLLFGYLLGFLVYVYTKLLYATCHVKFTGVPLIQHPTVVYCIWHESLVLYFVVFNKVEKQVWMNHPAWYMKPIHVLLHLTGVEHICLGSSGNSGRAALEKVIGFLKQGYATTIASDGPAGPAHELKPGVLFMSRDAQVPVIPLRFTCSRSWRLSGWDKKVMPGLFSEITVNAGEPVWVTETSLRKSEMAITKHLKGD